MSTDLTTAPEGPGTHTHPGNLVYVQVALVLAVLTGFEVALPYLTDVKGWVIVVLLLLMAIKFGTVAAMFMHLRFDNVIFRRMFVAGLILAVLVYIATLVAMQFIGDDTTHEPLDQRPHPAQITS